MNNFPNAETVKCREPLWQVRKAYPIGAVVELVQLNDEYTPIPQGTRGVVTSVDSTGTVFTKWSNGSGLGAVYCVDEIRRITTAQLIKEQTRAVSRMKNAPNMFSVGEVLQLAVDNGFQELAEILFCDTRTYSALIMTGKIADDYELPTV